MTKFFRSCLGFVFIINRLGRPNFMFIFRRVWFIFIRIKKGEVQGKEKCHSKSMMSKETNERLKRDTQDVPLRKNAEQKI